MLHVFSLSDRPDAPWQLPRQPLRAVAAFSVVVNLLLLMPSLFILQVFDRVFASGSRDTLLVLVIGVTLALLVSLLLDHLRSRLQGLLGNWLGEALVPDVLQELMSQGAKSARGAAPDALRDVSTLRNLFSAQGLLALLDAPWALVFVGVIAIAHPLLGLAAALAVLTMLALAIFNDRVTRRDIETLQRDACAAQRYLESSLANAEAAEAMGMTRALLARWRMLNARLVERQGSTAGKSVWLAATARSLRQVVQVVMTAAGAWLVITGETTAGVMVATTILLGRALAPVEQVVGSWKLLVEGRMAASRLRALLAPTLVRPAAMPLPAPQGALDAQGLIWRPPGCDRLVLGGVTFAVEPGESVAIIGPSGAGKSTLLRVLSGLWAPTAGTVRLDGADLAQWSREYLGPHLGYVPQGVELFPGTVAENIARLGPVDTDAVISAAKAALVHELVLSLPQGYDTVIEPGSSLLSPGQRQRIALARAMFGSPPVLLLDEPNSNLDGDGELALGQALSSLRGRTTVIMVTHRSNLVQHADKLLVLDGGRVKHFGKVSDVLQAMKGAGAQVVPMPRAASQGGIR